MSNESGSKGRAGYFWSALMPTVLLLVMPCASSQDFAEPNPPVVPPQVLPSPGLSGQRFESPDEPVAPGVEWTYHRSADGQDPQANEQKMLWYMNRARTDPTAEGVWLAGITEPNTAYARSYFKVDLDVLKAAFAALPAKPPAAFDIRLHDASEAHSLDLIARDAQDHTGQSARFTSTSFTCNGWRASVFSYVRSVVYGHAGLNIDWGLFGEDNKPVSPGMQVPPGHRYAIMGVSSGFGLTNVGLALVAEDDPATRVGPLVFSGAYCGAGGVDHNRFIVGTVWDDLDSDDEYDEGEGLGGVLVMPDQGTYYAVTGMAGGYAIPVTAAGTYSVSFSGGELSPTEINHQIVIGANSVLLDARQIGLDSDGDGVPDELDAFPHDPTETSDRDADGTGDNADDFPDDPTETTDSDGDGVGDNSDVFPNDPEEWQDTDGDGIGDNSDDYPIGHFIDVPPAHPAYHFIEDLADAGITAGCSDNRFCPDNAVTRAQLALLLERALHGSQAPPAATGAVFGDVGSTDEAAAYIEHLFADGKTLGCGNGNYCPASLVTRAQVAVALLLAKYGVEYAPPPAGGLFNDVPTDHWAARWIEQLVSEGISSGCSAENFCPGQAVTRDQLAVLLAGTLEY